MTMTNNEYFEMYLKNINDSKFSDDEKFKMLSEYNKKYFEEKDTSNIAYKFMREFLPISLNLVSPNDTQFEAEEFIKALSIINSSEKGTVKFLYFIKTLMKASEDILPVYPEEFVTKLKQLEKTMDYTIKYGVNNKLITIDENDKKILSNSEKVIKIVDHTEAAMADENSENSNKSKEVEKENSKDKKEDDKKKKEEKRKEKEEMRKKTEKWFDYSSLNKVSEELKQNTPPWYKVANRIATLLNQEEVQKLVGDKKFKLLTYQNSNDFAVISEDNLQVFWFKDIKEGVVPFNNVQLFNFKWAEAHADKEVKFTA